MGIALLTGFINYTTLGLEWSRFALKGSLIAISIAIAIWHQVSARRMSPAVRGVGQAVILALAVTIFGAAVLLI